MKNLSLLWLLAVAACSNQSVNTEAHLADSRQIAQSFMKELGSTLKSQIKAGGVESAIPVCKKVAPAIANKYSQDGKLVKRVSTKARNIQQGTPDQWELAALEAFEQTIQTDKAIAAPIEKSEITHEDGNSYYRYAKAIRVKPVCLNCHGPQENISANVKAKLTEHYPNDVATGYQLGDLRGAISIKQQLN